MKTRRIQADHEDAIAAALEVLSNGGLVAFPTDTVYGLGASIDDPEAIDRLYRVKDRSRSKAIPVLLGGMHDLDRVAKSVAAPARRLAERFWPGPLTLVVERQPSLPKILGPETTVGVRLPDHAVARALLLQTGPLAVTSANLSGGTNTCDAQAVLQDLGGKVELLLDGGPTPGGLPSTVVDCSGKGFPILRQGPISEEQVRLYLGLDSLDS